jgi:hypothetical protein
MFDRIIVGTNFDPTYFNFWKLQVLAHKTFFPDVKLTFALLDADFHSGFCRTDVKPLEMCGAEVFFYAPDDKCPQANQAKLLRYYCAAQFPNDMSILCDMDTVPLTRKYIEGLSKKVTNDQLLAVGREVYDIEHTGKFPAHHIAGRGYLFQRLYNTAGKDFSQVVQQHVGLRVFDHKEDARNSPYRFSDESLNRALIEIYKIPVRHITRDIDIHKQWLDRSWWKNSDVYAELMTGDFIEANMLRPCKIDDPATVSVIKYLESNNEQHLKYEDI